MIDLKAAKVLALWGQQQTSRALNVRGEQVPPAWKALEFMRTSLCELEARACNQLGNNS